MNAQLSPITIAEVLSRAVEQIPSIVVVTDTQGRIEYVNPAFCSHTGYTFAEVSGRYVSLLKSGRMPLDVYTDLWRQLKAGKEWRGEFQNRKKNGQIYWESAAVSAVRDATGTTEHYVKVAEDITQQKVMEAALKASQERYERVVTATRSCMFSVLLENGQPRKAIHYPGSLPVTGYTPAEYDADPQLWFTMIVEEDRAAVTGQIEAVLKQKKICAIEHRIRHKNGSVRWIRNTSVPTLDERGTLVGYDGLICDIQELKETQLRQEELLREMHRTAVRDPLTGLYSRRGFEEELNRAWQLGRRRGLSTGLLMLDVDHFKVFNDTYGHVVGDRILMESSRLITSTVRASDVVSRCGGDEIVVILPLTSMEETRRIGERLLTAFRERTFCRGAHDLHVAISIGAAIGQSEEETTQNVLMRADQALYRAKRLGRDRLCVADTDASGEAMEFAGTSLPDPGTRPPGHPPTTKGRILVVDDEAHTCTLLKKSMEKLGYNVLTAGTAAEAIRVAEKEQGLIDVALVDIGLPDADGYEVLRQIHRMDDSVAVIMITGHPTMDAAVEALRHAASDFIEKPFSTDQLAAVVERAMRHRHLLQENRSYERHLEGMVAERSGALTRALQEIKQSYTTTLEVMAAMIGARENQTAEHSKRVALMAGILARETGVSEKAIETVEYGALLHDIGKIAVPDAILLKRGGLTEEEWRIVREHPRTGYDIVRRCPTLDAAAEMVLAHQERFDGSGYPARLKGTAIPLGARVFAVVDAYDAVRSTRPYSPSQSIEIAVAEIVQGKGTQFDPEIVEAFLRCRQKIEAVIEGCETAAAQPQPIAPTR